MIYSVILRLLHVSSSNTTKTALHRALANDGYSKQIVFCTVGFSTRLESIMLQIYLLYFLEFP